MPKIEAILYPFFFQVCLALLSSESSLGTFWTNATYVSVSDISSRAGLTSAERFQGQADGNRWERKMGRKENRSTKGRQGSDPHQSHPVTVMEMGLTSPDLQLGL